MWSTEISSQRTFSSIRIVKSWYATLVWLEPCLRVLLAKEAGIRRECVIRLSSSVWRRTVLEIRLRKLLRTNSISLGNRRGLYRGDLWAAMLGPDGIAHRKLLYLKTGTTLRVTCGLSDAVSLNWWKWLTSKGWNWKMGRSIRIVFCFRGLVVTLCLH